MSEITVELADDLADDLRKLAATQARSETEIIREAVATYVRSARPLPKGMGRYRSGRTDGSERARFGPSEPRTERSGAQRRAAE